MTDTESITNPDPLLTVPECAAYVGSSDTFIRRAIRRGAIRATRLGRSVRVRRSALEDYLRAGVQ